MLADATTLLLVGAEVQVSRTNVATSAASSEFRSSADKFISPTKSVGGMIVASAISCAGTRHSLALNRLPAVSLASVGNLLIVTDAPGAAASTLIPSPSVSLTVPLLSWTLSVGAGSRCSPENKDDFGDCHVGKSIK